MEMDQPLLGNPRRRRADEPILDDNLEQALKSRGGSRELSARLSQLAAEFRENREADVTDGQRTNASLYADNNYTGSYSRRARVR